MNIGIDIDGTLTSYPEFFVALGHAMKAQGHSVYIITGLGRDSAIQKLQNYIHKFGHDWFDSLHATDKYNDSEKAMIGKVKHNEIIVGHFKQRICKELDISVMFDDQARIHRLCGDIPVFEVS